MTPTESTPAASWQGDEDDATTSRSSVLGDAWTRSRPFSFTVEHLLWTLLVTAAVISRFWDLGYRALHHDESLHTYYSWGFATGDLPYVHNPLMHGPFLFHANALIYQLFGVSDATSRLLPAAFGVLLVWLPWLLRGRHHLGPWGALAAGYLLLISPSFLYYTRYIRHDPYTAAGSLLLAIAVFRYLERPQRRWMLTAFVTLAFLLANHEIVFAIALVMVAILWLALLLTRLQVLIPVHILAGGLALATYVMFWDAEAWPQIPWQNATAETTRDYYSGLLGHPFVWGAMAVALVFVIGSAIALAWQARRVNPDVSMNEALLGGAEPNSIAYGVHHALRDPAGLAIGAVTALALFFGMFTTWFTNMRGIATATYAPNGTILYWLGQHDVQRGEQPWFYFITEGFQYEWLGIFFSAIAVVVFGVRLARAGIGGDGSPRLLFNTFNVAWFLFLFAVLSWAGEKMPWLIMHFALPGFLVAAALIDEIVDGAVAWFRMHHWPAPALRVPRLGMLALVIALVVLAFSWYFLASHLTYGQWTETGGQFRERTLPQWALNDWWMLSVPPLVALALTAVAIWVIGPRRAAYATLTALFIVFSFFQVHQGFRLAYLEGDVAKDTLIYNTTSPDVNQLSRDLMDLSYLVQGDASMQVGFDGCVQWPMNWYLRDMPNRQLMTTVPDTPETLPPVIIGVASTVDGRCSMPGEIEGYTTQTYVLRWHEPEQSIYREFAIAPEIPVGRSAWQSIDDPHDLPAIARSMIDSFQQASTPEGQQRLMRLVMFRELPTGLNPYRFVIHVRNDVLPYYNDIRYGD